MARDADADDQRRSAVGRADAVRADQRHHVDVDLRRRVRRLRHRRRRRSAAFFTPGATGGKYPTFVQFDRGNPGYNTDWNNFAPNVGVAWRPNVQSGWLRQILGDPDQATLRAGYSVAYNREGFGVYTGQYGANPGSSLSVTRNSRERQPGAARRVGWPLLLQPDATGSGPAQRSRGDADATRSPGRPGRVAPTAINIFRPDIEVAFARTYNLSFQRALSRDMAIDIRYVGTRGVNQWTEENYNERNIERTASIDEFKLAKANLQANIRRPAAATRSPTPAPAPARRRCRSTWRTSTAARDATNAAAYTGTNWTNTTFVGRLARTEPEPEQRGERPRRQRRRAAPTRSRPDCRRTSSSSTRTSNGVDVYHSDAYSGYDALQVELRRRLSRGFQINGSYQYALETRLGVPRPALRPRLESDRQRPARHQDAVGLDDAGRPRPALRHRHEPAGSTASSAAGSSTAPAASRRARSTSATSAWSA